MKKSNSQKTTGKKKSPEEKPQVELSEKPDLTKEFLIVGIGASAGGIQALKTFFENVPADSGMAYVVILHLSPDHDSQLAEVLQTVAAIPVMQVKKRVKVEPNQVYVVPPDKHLTILDGEIEVSSNVTIEDRRAPVDIFFRTLAESHQAHAVAVVLSGTGANGSMGLKRVKERGGACFVQNPREAQFSEMPRNSIATELVDRILNVAEIPAYIIAYKKNLGKIEISVEPETRPADQQQALREIFTQLRLRTGHDFSNYKRPTILRRIERRIYIHHLNDLPSYAAFVRENPDETNALLKDLLISVTNFFRDKTAFDYLETEILPKIFAGKTAEDQIRIWVAGCATGEEAYSLAMLCAERTLGMIDAPNVQIFATDIDEQAISTARDGLYTLSDAADVSPERLRRFFNKDANGYRVRRELREMILFANHNALKDSPFSRLDLATCRNMLIYLNRAAQECVMETFHFALNSGGFLFLGNSETTDGAGDLYAPVSREHHVYQSRQIATRIAYPVPDALSKTFAFDKIQNLPLQPETETAHLKRTSSSGLHLRLLEQYAPSIVINAEYEIVHISENALRFLQLKAGAPTQNLLELIRVELRLELRTALYQASQRQINVEIKNLQIATNGRDEIINLAVRPVFQGETSIGNNDDQQQIFDAPAPGFILVLFETAQNGDGAESLQTVYSSAEPIASQLEEELTRSKSQLRSAVEQYEVQAEELKASNEELQAINEELRSTAEELETGKEELQSVNEELVTVNQELKIKIEEVVQTNNDFQNLINSTDIATIFLDRSFRINNFTPAASRIFNLIATDCGRPLSDITNNLQDEHLAEVAETVLETLQVREREIRAADGRVYLQRVLPYRTAEDRIGGVVLTFTDITERKKAEDNLRESEEQKRLIIESAKDYAIFTLDLERCVSSWNAGAEALMGYTEAEILNKPGDIVFTPEDRAKGAPQLETETALTEGVAVNERFHLRQDGSRFWGSGLTRSLRDEAGNAIGFVKVMRDLTEVKRAEQILAESEEKYRTLFDSIDEGVATVEVLFDEQNKAIDYRLLEINPAHEAMSGIGQDVVGKRVREIIPTIEETFIERFGAVALTGASVRFEDYVSGLDRWFDIHLSRVGGAGSRTVASVSKNITERKRREANLAFLADTSADFAPLFRAEEIMERVGKRLADHLNLSRCNFSIVDEEADHIECLYDWRRDDSMPDLSGAHRISTFLSEEGRRHYAAGKFAVINDVRNNLLLNPATFEKFEELGLRSVIDAPYLKNGRWEFLLTAARSEASEWRTDEIELIRELAERVYIRVERARAEEALRESEERYGLATQAVKAVIYDWNITEDKIIRSQELENLVGFSSDETEIQTNAWWKSRVHPEDLKRAVKLMREKINSNATRFEDEYRVQHRSGHYVWVNDTGIFLRDEKGKAVRCVGSVTNITERKEAEETLRQSEERLRLLIESAEDYAIFAMTRDGIINSWNAGAEKTFGWTETEAIGQSCKIIFTPEDRKKGAAEKEMKTALRDGRAPDERFHLRKDGSRFYVSGVMTTLKDANGNARGFVKIARDMTENIAAEKLLRDKEMLQKLVGAQEDERKRIARDLHDELGQQLTALRLNLDKARKICEDEDICAEIDKMCLLAKSIDNGVDFLAWELRPAALDQFGLIAALENYIKQWAHHSGVSAELLASSLKRRRFASEVETNLYRIVQEALNNIHKHAKAKSVEVLLERRNDLIVLIIQDDGKGFKVEHKKTRGKGIGLIGMQERAALINGTLEIESASGGGTTVFVRVPVSSIKKGGSNGK